MRARSIKRRHSDLLLGLRPTWHHALGPAEHDNQRVPHSVVPSESDPRAPKRQCATAFRQDSNGDCGSGSHMCGDEIPRCMDEGNRDADDGPTSAPSARSKRHVRAPRSADKGDGNLRAYAATLSDLPAEMVTAVFQWSPYGAVVCVGMTCHSLHAVARCDALWRLLFRRDFGYDGPPPYHADHACFGKDLRWVYMAAVTRPLHPKRRDPVSGRFVGSVEISGGVLFSGEFDIGTSTGGGAMPKIEAQGYAACVDPTGSTHGSGVGGLRVLEGWWQSDSLVGPGRCWEPGYCHIRCDRWLHAVPDGVALAHYYHPSAGLQFEVTRPSNAMAAEIDSRPAIARANTVPLLALAMAANGSGQARELTPKVNVVPPLVLGPLAICEAQQRAAAHEMALRPRWGGTHTGSHVPPSNVVRGPREREEAGIERDAPGSIFANGADGDGTPMQTVPRAADDGAGHDGERKRWEEADWCQRYTGAFAEGRRHGFGRHCWTEYGGVALYEGEWCDNQRNGRGVLVSSDGNAWAGQWVEGVLGGPAVLQKRNSFMIELRTEHAADPSDDPHLQDHWMRIDARAWKISRTLWPLSHSLAPDAHALHFTSRRMTPHRASAPRVCTHIGRDGHSTAYVHAGGIHVRHTSADGNVLVVGSRLLSESPLLVALDDRWPDERIAGMRFFTEDWNVVPFAHTGASSDECHAADKHADRGDHREPLDAHSSRGDHDHGGSDDAGIDDDGSNSSSDDNDPWCVPEVRKTVHVNFKRAKLADRLEARHVGLAMWPNDPHEARAWALYLASAHCIETLATARLTLMAMRDWARARNVSLEWGAEDDALATAMPMGAPFGQALVLTRDRSSWASTSWVIAGLARQQQRWRHEERQRARRQGPQEDRQEERQEQPRERNSKECGGPPKGDSPGQAPQTQSTQQENGTHGGTIYVRCFLGSCSDPRPKVPPVADTRPAAPEAAPLWEEQGAIECDVTAHLVPANDCVVLTSGRLYGAKAASRWLAQEPHGAFDPETGESLLVRLAIPWRPWMARMPFELMRHTMRRAASRVSAGLLDAHGDRAMPLEAAWRCAAIVAEDAMRMAAVMHLVGSGHIDVRARSGAGYMRSVIASGAVNVARSHQHQLVRGFDALCIEHLEVRHPDWDVRGPWRFAESASLRDVPLTGKQDFAHDVLFEVPRHLSHPFPPPPDATTRDGGTTRARQWRQRRRRPPTPVAGVFGNLDGDNDNDDDKDGANGTTSREEPTESSTGADVDSVVMVGLLSPSFIMAQLRGVFFMGQHFESACFAGAVLDRCAFIRCYFFECVLIDAAVIDCSFYDCQVYDPSLGQWAPFDGAVVPLCALGRCIV